MTYGEVIVPPVFRGNPSAAFQRGIEWRGEYWNGTPDTHPYMPRGMATTMGGILGTGAWQRASEDRMWMRNGDWVFLGMDRGMRSYHSGLLISRGWWLIHQYREAGFLSHYTQWLSVASRAYLDMWRTVDWITVHGWPAGTRLLTPGGGRRTI